MRLRKVELNAQADDKLIYWHKSNSKEEQWRERIISRVSERQHRRFKYLFHT